MEAQGPGRRRECPVRIEDSGGGGVCTGRVGVCDSTGPGVETSILEQGRDTDGPASVERRVSHRGTVDSQGQVAWARGRPVRDRTFPLPGLHRLEAPVLPPPPRSCGSSEPQMPSHVPWGGGPSPDGEHGHTHRHACGRRHACVAEGRRRRGAAGALGRL